MLTRLYGCVTVRAGFLHPGGATALSATRVSPLRSGKMSLRSACTGEPASGAVPGILWLGGVRT